MIALQNIAEFDYLFDFPRCQLIERRSEIGLQ